MFKKYKLILLVILILGVFVMPSNFFRNMTKNVVDHIKYRGALVTGEITADNGDGTYNVKINNASSAYKNVETVTYGAVFSVGEIVVIGYEYGNKESPKILGSAKKIPQEPKEVEVDYSGGCAGVQTETVTIYSNITNGCVASYTSGVYDDRPYATLHDLASADATELNWDDGFLGQRLAGELYEIYRCFLIFDTSSIPTGATITSATLSFYPEDLNDIVTDFNVVIQNGQPNYPNYPSIDSDYYYGHYENNGGQVNTSTLTISAYHSITLNSNGKAWINKGGNTKFCLRSSRDIASITPTGEEYFYFWNLGDTTKRPKLTITYEI